MSSEEQEELQTIEEESKQVPEDLQEPADSQLAGKSKKKHPHRVRNIVIGVASALVIVVCAAFFAAFAIGVLAPPNAAARYGFFKYITEDECSEYIESYRTQMLSGDTSDEGWATFLAEYNMTPARLRASTIQQLLTDKLVKEKADELGITVTESDVDEVENYYKNYLCNGSDEVWAQTLEQYGQTEEGIRDTYRLSLLKQKVAESQVEEPTPTDDQVKTVIGTYIDNAISNEQSLTLKHSYCFKKSKSDSEGSLEEREEVEKIRNELVKVGVSEEAFASVVALYSDDETLKSNSGANGWDADTSTYSDEYVKALDTVGKNDVSSVFEDDDAYYFIWVSTTYKLPSKSSKAASIDLSKMPEALHQYFIDTTAYSLRQTEEQEYLENITNDVQVIYYDMPSDVPYNVDMSLAQTSTDDSSSSSDDSTSEGESDSSDSASAKTSDSGSK